MPQEYIPFKKIGMLTLDNGLIVTMSDGKRITITIQ
jgi:hypothetical protein